MTTARPLLEVQGLSKCFTLHVLHGKRVAALEDVSFALQAGTITVLLGRSGVGKSSVLKCIYRTYLPSGGHIIYLDATERQHDLATLDERGVLGMRSRDLGYVSQFLRPDPRVPTLELVARRAISPSGASGTARSRAAALLRRLNMPAKLDDAYPTLFSGGEQQRVNLARALIQPTRLLLLDEPTSALDSANQHVVVDLLEGLRRDGTTILAIFHDPDLVEHLADNIVVLESGRVSYAGPPRPDVFSAHVDSLKSACREVK
ncbi:MAG: ATP-binding cassette domain-containing protein [Chloroflexi bacterium]|nr:ATP-binding cassette domain-containing protein [Chloroflexota bacterium]